MKHADVMKRLGETDGQNGATWDPEVLSVAAHCCMQGESAYAFEGHPELDTEMDAFALAWSDCQKEMFYP